MASNFQFLYTEWPDIYRSAEKAERLCLTEPSLSAIQSRIALELAAQWMFSNDPGLKMPFDTSLASLMKDWNFSNRIPGKVRESVHLVRKIGNFAAHGREIAPNQSKQSLLILYDFLRFFSSAYGREETGKLRFNTSYLSETPWAGFTISEEKNSAQDKIAELAGREKELSEKRFVIDKEKKKNEALALRISQRIKASAVPETISFSEAETRILLIDINIQDAGWKIHNNTGHKNQCVREYPVTGMPGESGEGYADYVMWGENGLPLAVIEAKKTIYSPEKGKHQAELYADCLEKITGQRPVIFYTNGYETRIWDDKFYSPRKVSGFYSREELQILINRRNSREDIRTVPVNKTISGRYYQEEAVRRVTEHFCADKTPSGFTGSYRKSLLVMATGTGKTRTAIALVDLLVKAGWVSRVLFLADRNALVRQAQNAFKDHLPSLSTVDLTRNKEDKGNRIVLSTYPTIMNLIDSAKTEEGRFYTIGHFDLIIIDEAHRSVYQKYKAIFEYFDSMLVGLTATPKDEVDRDTYRLFDLPRREPTYYYELDRAVKDKVLVSPVEMRVPTKFTLEGVKYHDLSEEEKAEYEEMFYDDVTETMPEVIGSTALNSWLFNADTVRKVIDHLLKNGQKVEGGDKLGKTIIFAKNHRHAEFIQTLFYNEFPGLGGSFLEVIDNYADYALDLIDRFSDSRKLPQIAVSVDMLDTGIDIPEIVNLVFFKPVRSHSKFWQMIGRGTRLCPDLFGPGKDKKNFFIFDVCDNFAFFETTISKEEPGIAESISQRIFNRRLKLNQSIRNAPLELFERYTRFREILLNQLQIELSRIDTESFSARPYLRQLHLYRNRERLANLNEQDAEEISETLAPILPPVEGDEAARRFDLLIINLMLAKFEKLPGEPRLTNDLVHIAEELLKKMNIRYIALKEDIIRPLADIEYVRRIDLPELEEIRIALRDLAVYAEGATGSIYYSDFEDELEPDDITGAEPISGYGDMEAYKLKVESFLKEHAKHITISKLRTNKAITTEELEELERLIFEQGHLGTKDKFRKAFGQEHPVSWFVRSLVGLESSAARQEFSEYMKAAPMTATQIKFIDIIIEHLSVNGVIEKALLVQPPFTDINDKGVFGVFSDEQVGNIISIIDGINGNAERVAG
ncbi:MAG: DEAD/DEAH box helicase family protein [Bacteroidales bacterium]|nr:DEAD/DEAH box helicase family protein [Bacteroidales bacterium]